MQDRPAARVALVCRLLPWLIGRRRFILLVEDPQGTRTYGNVCEKTQAHICRRVAESFERGEAQSA